MKQINVIIKLVFLAQIVFCSCQPSLPDELPDLGIQIDAQQMNSELALSVSRGINSFKIGDVIGLDLSNLTSYNWEFNVQRDILIFSLENNKWIKVPDKMTDQGATDLVLDPKGKFPHGRRGLVILPDLENTQTVQLRIIVLAHRKDPKSSESIMTGAYTDITLLP